MKVFDELEIFVVLLSAPLENLTSSEELPGVMQILSTRSLKILYETKVQADRLRHPENPDFNSDKNEDVHDFSSARLNIWLTKKDESVLISLLLKTKLIFLSFNLDGSLWTF